MTTLKDIAEKAGVSIAAASTALSGRSGTIAVSDSTRERVLRIAEESGYRPNPLATSLRTGKTRTLGVCLANAEAYLTHPQGARRFWMMCEIAARHGYHVSILVPGGAEIDSRTVDGCLVMDRIEANFEREIARLAGNTPMLCMADPIPGAVIVHEDRSWNVWRKRAADYLYGLGHRRVAVVRFRQHEAQDIIPRQFQDAARERGIEVQIHSFAEDEMDRTYASIDRILEVSPLPSAVFAIDDDYARALVARLLYQGIRVPEDISVFSGSTSLRPDGVLPRLTGLVLKDRTRYEQLFREFVKIIDGASDAREIRLQSLEVEFVERDSCAPPPPHPRSASA
jgi:DNA-binding LacI/PurR family transcriptional regulator